jgi:hypothetical protein
MKYRRLEKKKKEKTQKARGAQEYLNTAAGRVSPPCKTSVLPPFCSETSAHFQLP